MTIVTEGAPQVHAMLLFDVQVTIMHHVAIGCAKGVEKGLNTF